MRRLRVFESISVDGYFCDAGSGMDWAQAGRDDAEFAAWVGGNASGGGALLFGRKTYQMMEAFWPTPMAAAQMPIVAKGMNAAGKYLASTTIQPTWTNTELLKGELVKAVRDLKASEGPDVTVLGSGSVVAQLGAAGLVDGGRFDLISGPRGYHSTGKILAWEPPRLLEYEWNVEPVPEMPRGERAIFRYELMPEGDATRVLVTCRRITQQTARGFLPGLHTFLDRLEAQLDGQALPDWMQRFSQLQAAYPEWSGHAPRPGQ